MIPHFASPRATSLYKEARAFLAPPRLAGPAGREGTLPGRHTFLEATGQVVLSALKRADDRDALVLRVFNPEDAAVQVTLRRESDAFAADLGEKRSATLPSHDGRVEIVVGTHQIRTLDLGSRDT